MFENDAHDTIEIRRQFYPSTGIMTLMDTLVNGLSNGTERIWNEKTGMLVSETFSEMGHNISKTIYDRNGTRTIQNYFTNSWRIKEEFFYDAQGKLMEEKHYNEKGELVLDKKY